MTRIDFCKCQFILFLKFVCDAFNANTKKKLLLIPGLMPI